MKNDLELNSAPFFGEKGLKEAENDSIEIQFNENLLKHKKDGDVSGKGANPPFLWMNKYGKFTHLTLNCISKSYTIILKFVNL